MGTKTVLLLSALLVGTLGLPTEDVSFFHAPVGRIVGGQPVPQGSVPHMVALTNGVFISSLVCGGSILSPRTVLTAAHCIEAVFSWGLLSSSLRGTVGTDRWNVGGSSYSFSRNVTHPHYIRSIIKNDIGILVTSTAITFGDIVAPVSLSYDHIDGGVPVWVAGYGRLVAGGAIPSHLQMLSMHTVDGNQCVRDAAAASQSLNVNAPPVEPHIEICTYHSPGHGTCNGDSGSALVLRDSGEQVGVVSWGFPCARGAPDMFVRISGFSDWLRRVIV